MNDAVSAVPGGSLIADEGPATLYVEPPFQVNHPKYWNIPPEVSGGVILESMRRRLGWPNYAGKRILDFGCGVRLARTIANLGLEIGQYVGIELQWPMVKWLRRNLPSPRFEFHHLKVANPFYLDSGPPMEEVTALPVAGPFDLACMFSVITHQAPADAARIFELLRLEADRLYFTAALKPEVKTFAEEDPAHPRLYCKYNPTFLIGLVEEAGWRVERVYEGSHYQEQVVIAR